MYTEGFPRKRVGVPRLSPGSDVTPTFSWPEFGLYGGLFISFKVAAKALLQWRLLAVEAARREENCPAGMSVGNTKERAEEVFSRPPRLPWWLPIVALRAQASQCVVCKFSTGDVSKATTRPLPTTLGAASIRVTMSLGK